MWKTEKKRNRYINSLREMNLWWIYCLILQKHLLWSIDQRTEESVPPFVTWKITWTSLIANFAFIISLLLWTRTRTAANFTSLNTPISYSSLFTKRINPQICLSSKFQRPISSWCSEKVRRDSILSIRTRSGEKEHNYRSRFSN